VTKNSGVLHAKEPRRLVSGRINDTLSNLRQQYKPVTLRVRDPKRWRSRGMRARNTAVGSGVPLQRRHWMWKLSIWP
jgi:hypothetical protein